MLGQDRPNCSPSSPDDQSGELSMLSLLGAWQRLIHREEGSANPPVTPCRDAEKAAGWLMRHHHWSVCNLEPYPDYHKEITRLARVCLTLMAEDMPHTVKIGNCPTPVDEEFCGTVLTAHTDAEEIICRSCQTSWTKQYWPKLGAAVEQVKEIKAQRRAREAFQSA